MTATKRVSDPPLMDTHEASDYLRVPAKTLRSWRDRGEGPPYIRVNGRLVRYRVGDVDAWLDKQTVGAA